MSRCFIYLGATLLAASIGFGQDAGNAPVTEREQELLRRIERLEARIAALESAAGKTATPPAPATGGAPPAVESVPQDNRAASPSPATTGANMPNESPLAFRDGTTINFNFDGYFSENANHPANRVSLLRTNDLSTNSFTVGQAGMIVERVPDASAKRWLGYRLDLMFGQNTTYLQGSAANEVRPEIYRNLFQAYGSVLIPVGKGLQMDFGKFASSLGVEGNYTKDQLNYSRSYFFSLLPYYHDGFRFSYPLTSKLTAQFWLVNGADQTEDFNGFHGQAAILQYRPNSAVSWNANYFVARDSRQTPDPFAPLTPAVVPSFPSGRTHVLDSYASFSLAPNWSATIEGDYVNARMFSYSKPALAYGGAGYLHRQISKQLAGNVRFEYLNDRDASFSGAGNQLKELTVTAVYQPLEGFQARLEYRHDWTNLAYYSTVNPLVFSPHQNTATLGLLWWFGGKTGAW